MILSQERFVEKLRIPEEDEQKMAFYYSAVVRTESLVLCAEFINSIRDEFYTAGAISKFNQFREYITRETHYAVEREGFEGKPREWKKQGMNPHRYQMIRNGVLNNFVISSVAIMRKRKNTGLEELPLIVSLDPREIGERVQRVK